MDAEKIAMFDRFLISQKKRLETGETLKVQIENGYLTIFNELDEETKESKTITLFEEFDAKLNLSIEDLTESD